MSRPRCFCRRSTCRAYVIINDLKETQYTAQEELPADLSQVFALIRAILVLQPQSVVQVNPFVSEHFIVASDASQDALDKEKQAFCLPVEWGRSLVLPS